MYEKILAKRSDRFYGFISTLFISLILMALILMLVIMDVSTEIKQTLVVLIGVFLAFLY